MLVIDDFATMARIMKMLAERVGFRNVDMCHDGDTALRMMQLQRYGYVICDIKMDPINGVEFAHLLRAEPYGKDCVILLTSADVEAMAAAVNSGIETVVDGTIMKPFNSKDLRVKLREIAAQRSATKGKRQFDPVPIPQKPRLHS